MEWQRLKASQQNALNLSAMLNEFCGLSFKPYDFVITPLVL